MAARQAAPGGNVRGGAARALRAAGAATLRCLERAWATHPTLYDAGAGRLIVLAPHALGGVPAFCLVAPSPAADQAGASSRAA